MAKIHVLHILTEIIFYVMIYRVMYQLSACAMVYFLFPLMIVMKRMTFPATEVFNCNKVCHVKVYM